ncbi:MAG: DUF1127 domain-containing protein [Pseudomonas sp.]
MNGLGDVRLVLRQEELLQDARVRPASRPERAPGISRWAWFWLRLRTRKALLELDAAQLRDIGLSAEQAREEGLKPFWRL